MDPTNTPQPPASQEKQILHFFLATGEVEYLERKHHTDTKRMPVSLIFRSSSPGIGAAALGKMQQELQMAFHHRYSRTHENPPHEITYCTLTGVSLVNVCTEEEFSAKALEEASPDSVTTNPPTKLQLVTEK